MNSLKDLLANNRRWADQVTAQDPAFFEQLSQQQAPRYLWIGCSDSRVPATQIVDLPPGEIFVHRNVANVVVHTDLNALSTIQFAVDVLKVKHILVVGHYGCGGVGAVLKESRLGLIDNWLRHITDIAMKHADKLDPAQDFALRHARLCELNALEQALNVCHTTVVQEAWERGQELAVHALDIRPGQRPHPGSGTGRAQPGTTAGRVRGSHYRTDQPLAIAGMSGDSFRTDSAPAPVGAYPHARRVGNLLFLSGVGPRQPGDNAIPGNQYAADGQLIDYDIEAQCHQVFANVRAVLEASGAAWSSLVDVTVFLTDMQRDFAAYNRLYAEYFEGIDACRTTLGIRSLPTPIAIELKCVAALENGNA